MGSCVRGGSGDTENNTEKLYYWISDLCCVGRENWSRLLLFIRLHNRLHSPPPTHDKVIFCHDISRDCRMISWSHWTGPMTTHLVVILNSDILTSNLCPGVRCYTRRKAWWTWWSPHWQRPWLVPPPTCTIRWLVPLLDITTTPSTDRSDHAMNPVMVFSKITLYDCFIFALLTFTIQLIFICFKILDFIVSKLLSIGLIIQYLPTYYTRTLALYAKPA